MSTLPIVEHVRRNIVDTLKGVRVAAGYNTDLIVVEYARSFVEQDAVCLVLQTDDEPLETRPENRSDFHQSFSLICYAIESESSTRSIDERLNLMRADVVKALLVDHTRGDYAIDTLIRAPIRHFDDAGRWDAIEIVVDVHYRTLYEDPYTKP